MTLLCDPPTDKITQTACILLGRALYVSSEFESDCRSLAFALKVQEPQTAGQSDDEFLAALSKAVLGRLVDLNNLIACKAKLKQNYAQMLHAARDARNYIVHEATSDLVGLVKLPDGFIRWQSVLVSKLEDIAFGRMIIAVLLSRNSAEAKPTQAEINRYPEKLVSWVFDGGILPSCLAKP